MKTVIVVALLAFGLVLPTSTAFAAEKKEGQKLQLLDQSGNNTNMTRRYKAKNRGYNRTRTYRSKTTRGYRTTRAGTRVRAYRTQRCDPFMRNVFGICTY